MEIGVAVWVKDIQGLWFSSIIRSKEVINGKITITARDDDVEENFTFQIDTDESLEIDNVKLCNDKSEAEVEDLIQLPFLHEPAILYCLEQRYNSSNIYTYTGPILLAVNPFKTVPLYTSQILETYYNYGLLKSQGIEPTPLAPHVYAIADAAYRDMMRIIMSSFGSGSPRSNNLSANQAILVSGESGAG